MLRVILATLGVALIAFGLFGGKSLEQVYAGLNGAFEKFTGGSSSQELVVDSTSVDSNTEQTATSGTVVTANTAAEEAEPATDDSVASVELPTTSQQSEAEPVAIETAANSPERKLNVASVQSAEDDSATLTKASVTNEPKDDNGALKEVKASARNEELQLALGTAGSENSELPKEADVGEILQTTTGGNNVEALFVLKDLVNMRQGPSIDHPIVLRLEKGQELMEFKRDGKWVHVGAYGTSGKIGWVHERLVGKTPG